VSRGNSDIFLYDISDGTYSVVESNANLVGYFVSGHVAFYRETTGSQRQLSFAPFNLSTGSFSGPSVTLEDPWASNVVFYAGDDGTAFLRPTSLSSFNSRRIGWYDVESNTIDPLTLESGYYERVSVAPDGNLIAVEDQVDRSNSQIVTLNLETGAFNRIAYKNPYNASPAFGTMSGKLYYAGGAGYFDPDTNVYSNNADGSGAEEIVVENALYPSVSADEKWIAFGRITE
jgi:hypothetical protein